MRLIARSLSLPLRLTSAGAAVRVDWRRAYHYKSSLEESGDPFGEKSGWEGPLHHAQWKDVDIEAFAEAMESPEVQRTHFGPDFVRLRSLAATAIRTKGSTFIRKTDQQQQQPDDADAEASATTGAAAAAADGDADGGAGGDRLVDKLTPQELAAAKAIMFSEEKVLSRNVEQEPEVSAAPPAPAELMGYRAPEALGVPKSIRPKAAAAAAGAAVDSQPEAAATEEPVHVAAAEQQSTSAAAPPPHDEAAAAVDADGIPLSDPLHWGTDDVIRWITRYGPADLDPDILDALRMSAVTGSTLLHKVVPCDLFKIMRKWHLQQKAAAASGGARASTTAPLVSLTTLQETVILCFPYGPP